MLPGTEVHRSRTPDPWWRDAVPTLDRGSALPTGLPRRLDVRRPGRRDAASTCAGWPARVEALGGTLTRMALPALPDRAEVVVNATGLGARLMADDRSVVPVRGQVVYVEQVGLERWWLDGRRARRTSCRARATSWSAAPTTRGSGSRPPHPDVARRSWTGPSRLVPELARARVLGHKVGLRPARPEVRARGEARRLRSCTATAHGGAGVTLSWGCADEVVGLVGSARAARAGAVRSTGGRPVSIGP